MTKLIVTPASRVGQPGLKQQLQVQALYSDGKSRDVTAWARFDSMDEAVLERRRPPGVVTAIGRGQAPVMVRYEGPGRDLDGRHPLRRVGRSGRLAEQQLRRRTGLGQVQGTGNRSLAAVRRRGLSAAGVLRRRSARSPRSKKTTAFLDSTDPDKRKKLIDRLLGLTGDPAQDIYNDKYAALWTLKWADLIRNNSTTLGESGMWALHNWLRESFRTNKPFDEFVRELVTAKGSIFSNGPANYYRIANNPPDLAESTSQLFLGVRLQCAKCHHHPFEKYSQADYYGFAAFFSRVGTKGSAEFGNFGGETVVLVRSGGEVGHPKTGQVMKPTPLDGEPVDDPLDRRIPLAKWLTSSRQRNVRAERRQPLHGLSAGARPGRADRRHALDQSAHERGPDAGPVPRLSRRAGSTSST